MAKNNAGEAFIDMVQEAIYGVADSLSDFVGETVDAAVDALAKVEKGVIPEYNIVVNNPERYTPDELGDILMKNLTKTGKRAKPAPSKTGGSDKEPSLEETLSVVYDYLKANNALKGPEGSTIEYVNKTEALYSYRSTITQAFRDHVWKDILGLNDWA